MHMLQCGAAYTPAIMQENTIGSLQVCSFILDRSILEITCWYCLCLRQTGAYSWKTEISADLSSGRNGWKSAVSVLGTGQCGFCSFGRCIRCSVCCDGCNDLCCDQGRGHIEDLSARQVVIMAAFSLYFGFTSEWVDNAAHVGGLICGFLLAVLLYHPSQRAG